jgi:hypothetical protein
MLKGQLVGAVLALIMTSGAAAQMVFLPGYGTNPCGNFIAAPAGEQELYLSWTLGFIGGQNSMDSGPMSRTGTTSATRESLLAWLRNYCSQNPLTMFVNAASQLRKELAEQQGLRPTSSPER